MPHWRICCSNLELRFSGRVANAVVVSRPTQAPGDLRVRREQATFHHYIAVPADQAKPLALSACINGCWRSLPISA